MLRPLSLLLLALLTAAPSFAANPVVVVRVFVLKHRRAEEAALRVRPYRTETGSVLVESRQNTLTVRDEAPAVEQMTRAIASYDVPPRGVSVSVTLLRAGEAPKPGEVHAIPKEIEPVGRHLMKVFGFSGFTALDSVVVQGVEGDTVAYPVGNDFRLAFFLEPTGDEPIVRMKSLSLERRRDNTGVDVWKSVVKTTINVPVGQGQTFVLAVGKDEAASSALFLVFTAGWRGPGPGIIGVR